MNFDLSADQEMMRETFARFFDEHSSIARVRAAMPSGFDVAMWQGLAELGAFTIRVPESAGGLELGLFDALLLMEEAGRTLASGPVAETLAAARLLAILASHSQSALLERVLSGQAVLTLAFQELAEQPVQWVAGGAVATAVLVRKGDDILLIDVPEAHRIHENNLGSTAIAELKLDELPQTVLASGASAVSAFDQAMEEVKLYIAAAMSGLAREAVRLAAVYASERVQFGQKIGTFQGISHPLADLITAIDGGKYYLWRLIHDIAHQRPLVNAHISLCAWWNMDVAASAVAQALHTFGGYGLTTEYDIHIFNVRAKAWALTLGDPARLLEEGGRRLYAGETSALPDVGEVAIDFTLGEEAERLAGEVDEFFKNTLTPELKAKAHYSWDGHNAYVHKKLAEAQLLFPDWPREYGGREASPYSTRAIREVWASHGWTTHAVGTTSMVATIIRRFGSEELKRDVLDKVVAGEALCSLGYSEPGSGSDVFAAQCRATRDGDGWRIDGTKMFTSGANISNYVLMLTRTNRDVAKHKGLTMFIVPLNSAGITVQPVYTFQGERTNITFYDGVKIPDSYRLGEVDGGVVTMSAGLEMEQGGGFEDAMYELLHAAENLCRKIQYKRQPLIEDVQAQMRLARAAAHTFVAEMLSLRSLWTGVEKKPSFAFGPMAKMFSSEMFVRDARDLLDLTAPYSLSEADGDAGFINLSYRHAQATTIYGGTSEVHRSMIAERNLGLPRSRA